jgi:hypothetical protein
MFKFRQHKVYKKPNKRITDKDEIIKYAKTYFYNNSLIDLWWFIHDDMQYQDLPDSFARDVAHKMVGTGQFKFVYTDHQKYFLITKASWHEAYPFRFAISVAIFSTIVSLIATKLTEQSNNQLQFLKDTQQDSLIQDLKQKVANAQIDTLHHTDIQKNVSKFKNADTAQTK